MNRSSRYVQLLAQLVLAATTVFVLFPYAWMLATSFKPIADVIAWPIRWIPTTVTLDNYAAILGDARFLRSLFNSAVVSVVVTGVSLVLSVPAAYGLMRLVRARRAPDADRHSRRAVLPADGLLRALLHHPAGGRAAQYARRAGLRVSVGHAADLHLDGGDVAARHPGGDRGGGPHRRLPRLPHSARHHPADRPPGIVTAGIFAFVLSWQEYIFALLYTTTERAQTAPVLLFYLLGQHQIDYARLMAAAVLLSIPIAVPFAIIQRFYRSGMTEGGIKG